jgi:hypothetical protein
MFQYTAIIIEPRPHKALNFVLNNFLENLSDEWGFIIFHGNKNTNFIQNIITNEINPDYNNKIKTINLGIDNLYSNDYSNLLKNKDFYNNIETETFLIFQVDTLIIKENKDLINDFLEYDYVGAPWQNGWIGNGGLSLRKKSKMLEVIDKVNKDYKVNEDEYFSYQNVVYLYRPSFEKAKQFAIETIYNKKSFGVHNCYNYLQEVEWEKLCFMYEDLKILKELNTNNPNIKLSPFTIIYKTEPFNLDLLEKSILSLKEYMNPIDIYEIIIYTHDILHDDIYRLLDRIQLKHYSNFSIVPLHYNYNGYIKQNVCVATSFTDCKTKYIVLIDEYKIFSEIINLKSFILENEMIEWKYMQKEYNRFNKNFQIWKQVCENTNLSPKNDHYSNNSFYIFTRQSLENAEQKFIDMHKQNYENFCYNKCHNQIRIEDNLSNNFNQLSQIFNEIEFIGHYCHNYSKDYIFTSIKNINPIINSNKKFTIVYKTYKNDIQWIEYSLLSLKKYLDTSNVHEIIIYTHDIIHKDIINMLTKMEIKNIMDYRIIPVHYNYHGYIKQMAVKASCYNDCQSEYIILLDSDLILQKPLNLNSLIGNDGKIEWKYLRKEDNLFNSVFTVWDKACVDSNKCPKNEHYMSNGFPFIFTRQSLENAEQKFIEMHNCDYDTYCDNRCGHFNIKVEHSITDNFHKLSQIFTEFEYLGFYCHNYSDDYIFTVTPYCKMDAQFQNYNNDSYFIQNWSHGGITEKTLQQIKDILDI